MSNLLIVECPCGEEVEVYDDDEEYNCPYCKETYLLVDEDDELAEPEQLEPEVRYDNVLIINRSIVETWCSKHRTKTEHAWVSSRRWGYRLACLLCWPSKRPKSPIYHRKKEIV